MGAGKKVENRVVGSAGLTDAINVASIICAVLVDEGVILGDIGGGLFDDNGTFTPLIILNPH